MDEPNEREWQDDNRGKTQLGLAPTPRQIEVFLTVLSTSSEKAAAVQLGLAIQTVKGHTGLLMARLGARSTSEVAALLWDRYPDLRPLMNLPSGEQGQRSDRRKGQRRQMSFSVRGTGRVDPDRHDEIEEAFRVFVMAVEAAAVEDGTPFTGALTWSHWTGDDSQQQAVDEITAEEVRDE